MTSDDPTLPIKLRLHSSANRACAAIDRRDYLEAERIQVEETTPTRIELCEALGDIESAAYWRAWLTTPQLPINFGGTA